MRQTTFRSQWVTPWVVLWLNVIASSPRDRLVASEGGRTQNPAELLKQFMSFPPIIEDLVYRKTMAGDLDSGLPLTSGAHSTNDSVTYGFARWQPQFLFLKLGHNTDVSQNGNQPGQEIDAKLGDDYWMVSPNGLISHWNDGTRDRDALRKKPSLVFDHHEKGQTIERVKAAHIAS